MKRLHSLIRPPQHPASLLLRKLDEQAALLSHIKNQLPDFLASHCSLCTLKEGKLTLYVDNAIWLSRIRFYIPMLLEKTGQHPQFRFNSIQTRVIPVLSTTPPNLKKRSPPSDQVASLLLESANHLDESKLKLSLERLGNTLKALRHD